MNILIMAMLALGAGNVVQWWMWGRSVERKEAEISRLKGEAEKARVELDAKNAEIKHLNEIVAKARRKRADVDKKVEEAVGSPDSNSVIELFNPYRKLQPKSGVPNPQDGRGSPNLQLEERPRIDLTDEEIVKLHQGMPVVTGKILKKQAAWDAYAEIAEGAVRGYRDYLIRNFSPKEK